MKTILRKYLLKFLIILILLTPILINFIIGFKTTDGIIRFKLDPREGTFLKKYAYIAGEVNNPGVYEINEEMKVIDLVNRAEGFTKNADNNYIAENINLAKNLIDGDHIFIPSFNSSPSDSIVGNSTIVNINTASEKELVELPEIGEVTAKKIIDSRPFNSTNELVDLGILSQSKLDKISALIGI